MSTIIKNCFKCKKPISRASSFGIFIILFAFFVCLSALYHNADKRIYLLDGKTTHLTQNWFDNTGKNVTLPLKIPYQGNGTFSFETTLPATYESNAPSLLVKGKYINTRIYLEDKLIGSYECRPDASAYTLGMQYLFLTLPEGSQGMNLRLEGEMLLNDALAYKIYAPILGDKGQILFDIVRSELPTLLVLFCVIAFAALLLLFSIQARSTKDGSAYFYTSLFSLVFALYSLFSSQTIYFFTKNPYFIYVGEFIMLSLLPLPLLILLYYRTIHIFKKLLTYNVILVTLHFISIILLHYLTRFEFRTTLIFTHIVIVISLVNIIGSILFGCSSPADRRKILIIFSPILVGTIGNLTLYYLPTVSEEKLFFLLCVLVFVVLQTFSLIHSYLNACRENIQISLYQKMAYTDALTGIGNRTAFEEKIALLSATAADYDSVWCIVVDVNDLKQVNDTMGHDQGDYLIIQTARLLQDISLKQAFLFRTGGDEFVIFAVNSTKDDISNALLALNNTVEKLNRSKHPTLSIALGYDDLKDKENDSIAAVLKRADAAMYKHKRFIKNSR